MIVLVLMYIVLFLLVIQLLFVIWNVFHFPYLDELARSNRPTAHESNGAEERFSKKTFVSILIPARNESLHIEACLKAILACDRTNILLEILVLDDQSEDNTQAIVQTIAQKEETVRVIIGKPLPDGWSGKCYACHQLYTHAKGEWLFFVDADVRFHPLMLQKMIAAGHNQKGGVLTGFPYQVTKTWLEKLVVPMMMFTIVSHLPIRAITRSKKNLFVVATGACFLSHRNSYVAVGGHAAMRESLVEDMCLAKAVKQLGHQVTFANVHQYASTRMYQNATEVWMGYQKNMYEGVGRKKTILFSILLLYMLLYLFPLATLIVASVTANPYLFKCAFGGVLLGIAIKRMSDATGSLPFWLSFFHPISIACFVAIGVHSWWITASGKAYTWKGRTYH